VLWKSVVAVVVFLVLCDMVLMVIWFLEGLVVKVMMYGDW
ncbi:hypothetical protein A2U01_0060531, partial [Trifolium medium]|nr:hypothetical protein [Trifolium medium]